MRLINFFGNAEEITLTWVLLLNLAIPATLAARDVLNIPSDVDSETIKFLFAWYWSPQLILILITSPAQPRPANVIGIALASSIYFCGFYYFTSDIKSGTGESMLTWVTYYFPFIGAIIGAWSGGIICRRKSFSSAWANVLVSMVYVFAGMPIGWIVLQFIIIMLKTSL